jgi:acetylornithine/succinyldiaminopimelate/putrescine aminotransferase
MRAVHVQHELAGAIVQQALEHGLLLNSTAPDTLRMIPPLNLTRGDIDEAAELLDRTLAVVASLPAARGDK